MLYGRGAGGRPTASAVRRRPDRRQPATVWPARPARRPTELRPASGRWTKPTSPFYISSRRRATVPVSWARWPPCSATMACPSGPWSKRGCGRGGPARLPHPCSPGRATCRPLSTIWPTLRRGQVRSGACCGSSETGRQVSREPTVAPGAGSSRSTASSCRLPTAPRWSPCSRAARPLLPAPRLSERVGARVLLKVEGANPTGSFKDRGMTVAITKAVEEGAKGVVCASTGNTSASAAAFAARAGLTCAVLIPEGHIALGKLAQALSTGPRSSRCAETSTSRSRSSGSSGERAPVTVVNSVNPYRIEGQKSGAFEIVDELGDAPDVHCIPVGNAGNITAYWKGYLEYKEAGRSTTPAPDAGVPGGRRCPDRGGSSHRTPRNGGHGHPDRQSGELVRGTSAATESGGGIAAVTDDEILAAYRFLAHEESVFCEPASAASVAGLLKTGVPDGPGARRHRGVCAHRARPERPRYRHQPDHQFPL